MKWFISVVAIVAATTITLAQYPEGHWQNFAPYPQPTQEVGGAVVNGKLYILGAYGANAPGGLAGWLNEYDPASDASMKPAALSSFHSFQASWIRVCWCSWRYMEPFRCPLRISSTRTPKLKTSDFTEKTPSIAYSGAMYPLHFCWELQVSTYYLLGDPVM